MARMPSWSRRNRCAEAAASADHSTFIAGAAEQHLAELLVRYGARAACGDPFVVPREDFCALRQFRCPLGRPDRVRGGLLPERAQHAQLVEGDDGGVALKVKHRVRELLSRLARLGAHEGHGTPSGRCRGLGGVSGLFIRT
jgi:hypothetical protein